MVRSRTYQEINFEESNSSNLFNPYNLNLLQTRLSLLSKRDRALMDMFLNNAQIRQIAQLNDIHEANVSRRVQKLLGRLFKSHYLFCMRNRYLFNDEQINIAREHFMMALPMCRIAHNHKTSYYKIRETIKKIKQLIKTNQTIQGRIEQCSSCV